MTTIPLPKWLERTKKLLAIEKNEEIQLVQEELATLNDAENPNVLVNLRLEQYTTGLFGRTVVQLAFPSIHVQKPKPHQFTVGDLVQIRCKSSSSTKKTSGFPTGIVARVEESSISIALSAENDVEEEELMSSQSNLMVDRLVNNATYAKIDQALEQLAKLDFGCATSVVTVVFHGKDPEFQQPNEAFEPLNDGLNASQKEAIAFALASKDIALIHGPPGTGKTTTVVEFIQQAVLKYNMKVLVCAPSNIAVDNVLEKIAASQSSKKRLQLTRIGHPARVLPQILPYCLDAKIATADGTEIVNDIRKEMQQLQSKLQKTKEKSLRYTIRQELKANRKEIRQRERNVVSELIRHSDVVFATNVGAASKLLDKIEFDVVVIDEAAQALEASCWIPILKAKRCVLAGDHCQLPPTIKSQAAARAGLDVTLFDRLTKCPRTQSIVKMLTIQYRMHQDISDWSSKAMYHGKLDSFPMVAARKLHQLAHVSIPENDEKETLDATLLLIDTAGCGVEEDVDENEGNSAGNMLALSKSNAGEARIVEMHVRALLATGLRQEEVAVITPYNKQVQLIKSRLRDAFPRLEVRSVDGFQGCEKEAVVMSLVRSNAQKQVGFLADDRRMNVAITRAKRHVALICDTDTISSHKFLKQLLDHFEQRGEIRSAHEYLEDEVVQGAIENMQEMMVTVKEEPKKQQTTQAPPSNPKPKVNAKQTKGATKDAKKLSAVVENDTKPKEEEDSKETTTSPEPASKAEEEDTSKTDLEDQIEAEKRDGVEPKRNLFELMANDDSSDSDDDTSDAADPKEEKDANANALLKELHQSRMARQAAAALSPPPAPQTSKKNKKKTKKNANKSTAKTQPAATHQVDAFLVGEDELAFLTRQAQNALKCAFHHSTTRVQCKKTTSMMGSVCRFCHLKFCFEHAQPEIHGCGLAVRQFERTQHQEQSTKPTSKPLRVDQRKLLQRKLEEKVTTQTNNRKAQSKKKAK